MWDSIKWLIPNAKLPTWMDGLVALILIIIGCMITQWIVKPLLLKFARFLRRKGHPVIGDIIEQFVPTIRHALFVASIVLGLSVLFEVWFFTYQATKNFFISMMFYFAFKGVYDVLSFYLRHPERFETGRDQDILTPFFLRISKVMVMTIAMFSIASLWNFNLNGFLTAIGLTGVALAFGIRDTLAHIFGGMSVALDKPFQIGDWIMTGDEKIEGVVEDINLRSTLITTSDKGLVYVPNSYLVNRPIYNLSKRSQRKVEYFIFVSSDNTEGQVVQFIESLREQITLHPKVLKNVIHVAMDEMRPGSNRIIVRFFVDTNDTATMLQTKQDILFVSKQFIEDYNIKLVSEQQGTFTWND